MKTNENSMDRILRVVIGLVLVGLAYAGNFGTWAWAGYVVGAVLIGTAAIGWCPAYALFGWNTCSVKGKS